MKLPSQDAPQHRGIETLWMGQSSSDLIHSDLVLLGGAEQREAARDQAEYISTLWRLVRVMLQLIRVRGGVWEKGGAEVRGQLYLETIQFVAPFMLFIWKRIIKNCSIQHHTRKCLEDINLLRY